MPSERKDIVKGLLYDYRLMRSFVRYYLKYTPEILEKMTLQQLAQAYNDIVFVRSKRSRFEPED